MQKATISLLFLTIVTSGVAIWLYSETRSLEVELSRSRTELSAMIQEIESLEENLRSARIQLMNLSASLQEAREDLNGETRLRTRDDLSNRLHGAQPPDTSVAPPPGYTGNRPPGSRMDIARQMAEMQANIRYGDFVESLQLDESAESDVRDAIASVFAERVEVSRQRASGAGSDVSLEEIASTAYLREQLATLLNDSQLQQFDAYEASFQELQQRNLFALELAQVAPALNQNDRDLVLDVVLKHLGVNLSEGLNPQANAVSETQRQLAVLTAVRVELRDKLGQAEMQEAEKFLGRIATGMIQSQTMNEGLDQ